jgi:hypothetical protein
LPARRALWHADIVPFDAELYLRLAWREGELRAPDHAGAERTLAALGGERCACVEMLDAWHGHASDLRVLVLGSRGSSDPLAAPRNAGPEAVGRFGWLSRVWAPDLAVVAGRFCLAAEAAAGCWRLSVLDPDLGPPQRLSIELAAGG